MQEVYILAGRNTPLKHWVFMSFSLFLKLFKIF